MTVDLLRVVPEKNMEILHTKKSSPKSDLPSGTPTDISSRLGATVLRSLIPTIQIIQGLPWFRILFTQPHGQIEIGPKPFLTEMQPPIVGPML